MVPEVALTIVSISDGFERGALCFSGAYIAINEQFATTLINIFSAETLLLFQCIVVFCECL